MENWPSGWRRHPAKVLCGLSCIPGSNPGFSEFWFLSEPRYCWFLFEKFLSFYYFLNFKTQSDILQTWSGSFLLHTSSSSNILSNLSLYAVSGLILSPKLNNSAGLISKTILILSNIFADVKFISYSSLPSEEVSIPSFSASLDWVRFSAFFAFWALCLQSWNLQKRRYNSSLRMRYEAHTALKTETDGTRFSKKTGEKIRPHRIIFSLKFYVVFRKLVISNLILNAKN